MAEPIVVITVAPHRRWLAIAILFSLGVLLLSIIVQTPPAFIWIILMGIFGIGAIALAEAVRRATALQIYMTEEGVYDSAGQTLFLLSDVTHVERGTFAIKPSNGFVVRLRDKPQRAWVPGMWWRIGHRVGVGGVVPSGAARFMAEQIAARIKS